MNLLKIICCYSKLPTSQTTVIKAVVYWYSKKWVFLKKSQNLRENTCAVVFFLIKLVTFRSATLWKDIPAQLLSCEFFKIFKNVFFKNIIKIIKVAATYLRCFVRSKFCRSLVHKKVFDNIKWHIISYDNIYKEVIKTLYRSRYDTYPAVS